MDDMQAKHRWAKLSLWDPSLALWVSRGALIVPNWGNVQPIDRRTRLLTNRYLVFVFVPKPVRNDGNGIESGPWAVDPTTDLPRGLQPSVHLTPIPGAYEGGSAELLHGFEAQLEAGYDLEMEFGDELTVAGHRFALKCDPHGRPLLVIAGTIPTPL